MLDFLYLLRKASWNLLKLFLFSVQPQHSIDGEGEILFFVNHMWIQQCYLIRHSLLDGGSRNQGQGKGSCYKINRPGRGEVFRL